MDDLQLAPLSEEEELESQQLAMAKLEASVALQLQLDRKMQMDEDTVPSRRGNSRRPSQAGRGPEERFIEFKLADGSTISYHLDETGGFDADWAYLMPLHESGVALLDRGDYRGAIRVFEEVLRRAARPIDPMVYQNLAVCHAFLGEFPRALRILETALQIWPNSSSLRQNYDDIKADAG